MPQTPRTNLSQTPMMADTEFGIRHHLVDTDIGFRQKMADTEFGISQTGQSVNRPGILDAVTHSA